MISRRKIDVLSYLVRESSLRVRPAALIQTQIYGTIFIQVIFSYTFEIHSIVFLGECLAFLPSDDVIVPESFAGKLDCTFPADFKDHSLVLFRDMGIHFFHILIRIAVCHRKVNIRHTYPVPDLFNGVVEISLCEGAELRLCLCIVEIDLGCPEYGQVYG